MKKHINGKAILAGVSVVVLSLWAGYAIGYKHGVRDEERKWWSSVSLDPQGNRVFLGPQGKAAFNSFFMQRNPIPDKAVK